MAKKETVQCASYSEAETLMVNMDAVDRKIGKEQADMDAILDHADRLKSKIKELIKDRKAIFDAIEKFAQTRRGLDFTGEDQSLRKKALKRGEIGFRLAPAAVQAVSRDWTEDKVIAAIEELVRKDPAWKKHTQAQLVRIKKTLNKDAIKDCEFNAEDLAKAGLEISQEDVFWAKTFYEMEMAKIAKEKTEKAA